jgi:hypothetical protein
MSVLPDELVPLAERLCEVLTQEARRYRPDAPAVRLESATLRPVTDPANGLPGYDGHWRDAHGQKCGSLAINSDGSYYAEYDILVLHPRKPRWFVEAVTAWGRDGLITAEPRLLAAV